MDLTRTSAGRLAFAAICGVVFGFLLQKGGVAKHHVLVGALLLQDFTVFKVMLSAIVVGMAGVLLLSRLGVVSLHVKPLRWAANVIGGLIFGLGFALAGYCPGTQAAAIGQGNLDAWFGALGMIVGSWLYALASDRLRPLERAGERGDVTLPRAFAAPLLIVTLVVLGLATVR